MREIDSGPSLGINEGKITTPVQPGKVDIGATQTTLEGKFGSGGNRISAADAALAGPVRRALPVRPTSLNENTPQAAPATTKTTERIVASEGNTVKYPPPSDVKKSVPANVPQTTEKPAPGHHANERTATAYHSTSPLINQQVTPVENSGFFSKFFGVQKYNVSYDRVSPLGETTHQSKTSWGFSGGGGLTGLLGIGPKSPEEAMGRMNERYGKYPTSSTKFH